MDKLNLSYERNRTLQKKARHLIPGGAHTYSKGDDQFPLNAPSIIERGEGCYLYDVDGNKFLDMGMSLGTVILGHSYPPVLEAVRKELKKGVNFIRPSMIEGELAELLTEIIPCAEMVKFAKNGSDVTTAAIRLARAYTGRDYIIRCKNDPFNAAHDWFIGSTVMSRGIPRAVRELTLQFAYNDLESVKDIFSQYPQKIACILLEPVSMIKPDHGFLEQLKKLCEDHGALLIFDEVVSGFRFSLGGAQEMVAVTPHLSAFGKAMANGFSVSALVGLREIMQLGGFDHEEERIFLLSSTHGGETHSLSAAKVTIQEIQKHNIIQHFWNIGDRLMKGVERVAKDLGAEKYVDIFGYPCRPGFFFRDEKGDISMASRTLFLQETAARGLLIPYVVPSYSHRPEHIDMACEIIGDALSVVKEAAEGEGILSKIVGPVVKSVFRRYN